MSGNFNMTTINANLIFFFKSRHRQDKKQIFLYVSYTTVHFLVFCVVILTFFDITCITCLCEPEKQKLPVTTNVQKK